MKFTIKVDFFSSRSQSAFATSGGFLHIFGGYSRNLSQNWAMSTMQSVGLEQTQEEREVYLDSESDTNRFAAAMTLMSGAVILTGGRNRPREVFHLNNMWGQQNWKSKRLADMTKGRYGHAITVFFLKGEENVIVAGGCNGKGEVEESVEMYSLRKNSWILLQNLPTPRIYFTLQVDSLLQHETIKTVFSGQRNYTLCCWRLHHWREEGEGVPRRGLRHLEPGGVD